MRSSTRKRKGPAYSKEDLRQRRLKREKAKLEERIAAIDREEGRRAKWTPKQIARMKKVKAELAWLLRQTAKKMKHPASSVRDFLYPDGRAIVALKLEPPPGYNVHKYLLEVEYAWEDYPPGTFFEASFLFDPEAVEAHKYETFSHYGSMKQIQSYGTLNSGMLFVTMQWLWEKKLKPIGLPKPNIILFRVGRSVDESKPFTKKNPPA